MSLEGPNQGRSRDARETLGDAGEVRNAGPRARGTRPRVRRPISSRSPLEGRQLWRIGDWGGASEQIGRRWEALGARALQRLVGMPRPGPQGAPYVPRRAIVLSAEPALADQVQAVGKSHADAILLGEAAGRSVLEPVDFKWTLETANPRQISAEILGALLAEPPPLLAARLAEGLADLPYPEEPVHHDGIFLAPDHAENRAFMNPPSAGPMPGRVPRGVGLQPGTLDPTLVVLCPVDPTEFFEPLLGWDVAGALALADGAYLDTLEMAERYYRLGTGVLGALRRLEAGLFGHVQDLDGPAELARLRRGRRFNTTGEVIAYLDRAMIARSELLDRLKEIERAGYPFGLFRADLVARGLPAAGLGTERRWGRLYGGVIKAVGEQMRVEGRQLVGQGQSEAQALGELDGQRARWTALARRVLDQGLTAPEGQGPWLEGGADLPASTTQP